MDAFIDQSHLDKCFSDHFTPSQLILEDEGPVRNLGPVHRSPLDFRNMKVITLANGLKVMLISTVGNLSSKSTKKCRLGSILKFNKACLGLSSEGLRIRCECEGNYVPLMADNSTSTGDLANTATSSSDDLAVRQSFFDSLKSVRKLLYGESSAALRSSTAGPPQGPLPLPAASNSQFSIATTMGVSAAKFDAVESNSTMVFPEDEICQEASAYLTVGAGWFNDPVDMPGLAHFVEHCFFLGSKKFPYPNQLLRLLNPYDGYTNATTMGSQTMYTVSSDISIFELALEMMADAASSPLLPKELVTKELDAIDSEYSTRQDDVPKYLQLLGSLVIKDNPMSRMDSGNKDTLKVRNFYNRLVQWRASHYSANYMTLVLEAPMEISDLQRLAVEHFSNIPSSSEMPPWMRVQKFGCPYDMTTFHKIYKVPSIYHTEFMAIHWTLEPEAWKNLTTKPLDYLGALISSKADGGLYQVLHYFGWITNLSAGCPNADVCRNFYNSIFSITMDLTESGFQHQLQILQSVFAYLKMLTDSELSLRFFQELQHQQVDYFHHRAANENLAYGEAASMWLQYLPPEYVLAAPHLSTKYDEALIRKYLHQLDYNSCNVMIFSKKFLHVDDMQEIEKFYKTPYSVEEFPKRWKAEIDQYIGQLAQAFQLPEPNEYLNEITCCGTHGKNLVRNGPIIVLKNKCAIFYKDNKFQRAKWGPYPQEKFRLWLHSPVIYETIKNEVMTELFAALLSDIIESRFSSALAADVQMDVKTTLDGRVEITLAGPVHLMGQILREFFQLLGSFEDLLEPLTFEVGKRRFIEELDDIILDNLNYAWNIMDYLLSNCCYRLCTTSIQIAENIDLDTFKSFVMTLKHKVFIGGSLNGYVTIENAYQVVQIVSHFLQRYSEPVHSRDLRTVRSPKFPLGEHVVKVRSVNARVHTSVVVNAYQFGNINSYDDEIVQCLARMMMDCAYHQLRTVEQLGYIVNVYHESKNTVTTLFFELVTQPKRFTTAYCNDRINQFFEDFYQNYLSTESKFDEFLRGKPSAEFPLKQLQSVYKLYLLPNGDEYRKISIQIVGRSDEGENVSFLTHWRRGMETETTEKTTDVVSQAKKTMKTLSKWHFKKLSKYYDAQDSDSTSGSGKSMQDFPRLSPKGQQFRRSEKGSIRQKSNYKFSYRPSGFTHSPLTVFEDEIRSKKSVKRNIFSKMNGRKTEKVPEPRESTSTQIVDNIHEFKAGLKLYPNSNLMSYERSTMYHFT